MMEAYRVRPSGRVSAAYRVNGACSSLGWTCEDGPGQRLGCHMDTADCRMRYMPRLARATR